MTKVNGGEWLLTLTHLSAYNYDTSPHDYDCMKITVKIMQEPRPLSVMFVFMNGQKVLVTLNVIVARNCGTLEAQCSLC